MARRDEQAREARLPERPAGVQELITEERQHLKKAERTADRNPDSAIAQEAEAHAARQVRRAVTIGHYEKFLDVALLNLDVDLLFPEILGRVSAMLAVQEATVFLLDREGRYLYAKASLGLEEPADNGLRIPVGHGPMGSALAERRPQTLDHLDAAAAFPADLAPDIKSLVAVPILVGAEALGVLMVGSNDDEAFAPDEVRLLEVVAERIGLAIERTRSLRLLQSERERAERASRFKTMLLNMASHDIKTPLTAMNLQLEMLKARETTPEAVTKGWALVDRSLARLQLILDDLLDLAQVEAGAFTLKVHPVDLYALAEDVVALFAPQAAQRGLELRVTGHAVTVVADERRLTQVLVNLVSNALRYTAKGSVVVMVGPADRPANVAVEAAQEAAQMVVTDTGRGMTAEQLAQLFQPFGQVHGGVQEGTGLGLYLAKVIMDAHGGNIWVESAGKDLGTSVIIELPVHGPPPKEARGPLDPEGAAPRRGPGSA